MFFNGWYGLIRLFIVGFLAYVSLIVILRVFGKRTLSKMNAFDLVVTVALGSTLATILLSKDVPLLDGVMAFLLLVCLQYLIAWLSVRSKTVSNMVKAEPSLLFYAGHFLNNWMNKERVTEGEVISAVRAQGIADLDSVLAVVLETDGTFAVLRKQAGTLSETALKGVQGAHVKSD